MRSINVNAYDHLLRSARNNPRLQDLIARAQTMTDVQIQSLTEMRWVRDGLLAAKSRRGRSTQQTAESFVEQMIQAHPPAVAPEETFQVVFYTGDDRWIDMIAVHAVNSRVEGNSLSMAQTELLSGDPFLIVDLRSHRIQYRTTEFRMNHDDWAYAAQRFRLGPKASKNQYSGIYFDYLNKKHAAVSEKTLVFGHDTETVAPGARSIGGFQFRIG